MIHVAIYEVTVTHRYEIDTDNIEEAQKEYEFPDFQVPSINSVEFIDSSFTYEEKE